MNNATLLGRFVRDPEVRYTASEKAVCSFTLAVDRQYKSEGQPSADFINCKAFGKLAENIGKYMTKGRQIALAGRIETGSYVNKDGNKVYTTEVVAEKFTFVGSKSDAPTTKVEEEAPAGFEAVDEDDLPF